MTTPFAASAGVADAWSREWSAVAARTGPADREQFEWYMRQSYEIARLPWHGHVIWVPSPMAARLAAPVAELVIGLSRLRRGCDDAADPRELVERAVSGATSLARCDFGNHPLAAARAEPMFAAVLRAAAGDARIVSGFGATMNEELCRSVCADLTGALESAVWGGHAGCGLERRDGRLSGIRT